MGTQILRLATIAAAFAGGAVCASWVQAEPTSDRTYQKLEVFARVLRYVSRNYVQELPPEELVSRAIKGMVQTLDSHSAFLSPEQFAAMRVEAQPTFGGIGVELLFTGQKQVVLSEVHAGGPAARAGLLEGDRVLKVAGQSVKKMSLTEVAQAIKGEPGTEVKLAVQRAEQSLQVEMTRAQISPMAVSHRRVHGVPYIRIRRFVGTTYQEMLGALSALKAEGPVEGLILDLRDNPGGLLTEAVRVADTWLKKGLIVSTEGRGRLRDQEKAHPQGTEPNYPVVILVNGGTASAAEIVAGALKDHGRAELLGTQTFGKGSVQTIIELEDHSALRLTVARYFTPSHHSIEGTGIPPDIRVTAENGPQDLDPQLQAALEHLGAGAETDPSSVASPDRSAN